MAKKFIISLIYLIGCITYTGIAQSSQATMQVSVRVVSGTSIEANQLNIAILSEIGDSDLGNIKLNGIDHGDALISISEKVLLKNSKGNEINLDINTQENYNEDHTASISFKGSSKERMKSGSYSGKLTTTIQYM